ncbi:MAG: hypothetical protein JWN63_31, partial [Candidatus Acidoferrum typicum]|nr:hypothetical protein [Candidatus Acidoferrum typicum]
MMKSRAILRAWVAPAGAQQVAPLQAKHHIPRL